MEAIKNKVKLSEVFRGTVSLNFLYDRFTKNCIDYVHTQVHTNSIHKKAKVIGYYKTVINKKARLYFIIELFLVHPQGFEPRTF